MIGGLMLLMTVSAMGLILLWANKYDDLADSAPRGGFFSMTAGRAGPLAGKKRRFGKGGAGLQEARPPVGTARRKAQERWGAPDPAAQPAVAKGRRPLAVLHEAEAAVIAAEIAEAERDSFEPRRRAAPEDEELTLEIPFFARSKAEREAADLAAQEAERAAQAAAEAAAREALARRETEAMEKARRRFGGLS